MNGYMIEEKVNIARNHLLPKQLKKHGINESKVVISDEVFEKIINGYTYESGVRELERQIAGICRKIAMKYVDKGTQRKITLHKDKLKEFLGLGMDTKPSKVDKDESGAVTGLAWTQCGGNTLIIEVSLMAGSGDILLTGQLGDIMQESAKTAITLVRSRAKDFGLDPKIFKKTDIHIHVPEGAIQKDGPSAGITIATAVLSAFTGKTIKEDVAMTGEVTLRGKVLPIGGLKEKALAAVRAGIKTVIIPAENNKEMEDLPESIRKRLDFIIAADIDTVFKNSINGV